jgi:hypothetical protein
MMQAAAIGATMNGDLFALERAKRDPDERQGRHPERDGAKVIGRIVKLDGFVTDIVGRGATESSNKVLPQVIARNALGSLQKKYDQAGKDNDCRPVVRRFHRFCLQIVAASTIVSVIVAIVMTRTLKKNLLVSFVLIAKGGFLGRSPARRLFAGAA